MSIEEIKKKYESEVTARKQKIAEAERKRDAQRTVVNFLKAEREKLRPFSGVMDNESRARFNHLTFRITQETVKLERLENEFDESRTNADLVHQLNTSSND